MMNVFLYLIIEADSLNDIKMYKVFIVPHLFSEVDGHRFLLKIASDLFTLAEDIQIGFVYVDLGVDIDFFFL